MILQKLLFSYKMNSFLQAHYHANLIKVGQICNAHPENKKAGSCDPAFL